MFAIKKYDYTKNYIAMTTRFVKDTSPSNNSLVSLKPEKKQADPAEIIFH